MNRSLHQYNEHQQQQSFDIASTLLENYLECDKTTSENIFDDLFSDFENHINDFESTMSSVTDANFTDSSSAFSSSKKTNWQTGEIIHSMQSFAPDFDEVLSSDSFKLLFDPYQNPPSTNALSSSPHCNTSQEHYESSLINASTYQWNGTPTKTNAQSTLPSVQYPEILQKTEPITVTLDQFHSLLRAIPHTSNTNTNAISTLLENSTIIGNNIPLRIIHESSHCQRPDNSNKVNGENSLVKNNTSESIIVSGNDTRSQRKSSQNAIEKRYRSSINERINELKEIVAATDGKIQKSGVLRRTIEYIAQLQSTNRRLEEENSTLKNILKQLNLTNVDLPSNNDDDFCRSAPKRKRQTKSKRGMVDGSRLVLCCFMLCVLLTNPFNHLLDRIHTFNSGDANEMQTILSSRTLQGTKDRDNFNSLSFLSISWKKLIAWLLNIAICLVCLVKIFVHGEPIVNESDMDEYYAYKKKADTLMNENQLNEAHAYYRKCCEKLFISLDNTYFYYFTSITWQIIRWHLNVIVVGRWLTYWSGWTKSIDTRNYNRELNDCCLQLWKIEYHYSKSLLSIFNLFLLTINTSINSGKKLDRNKHNEIWLLSALTFKKLDGLFSLFIPYVLKFLMPIDIKDVWLYDIHRLNQFIFEQNINLFKRNAFIESIRVQFFEYILYDNIHNQLLFQNEQQNQFIIKMEDELDEFTWWQHTLQVIRCISNDKQNINNMTPTNFFQQMKSSNKAIYHRLKSIQIVNEQYIAVVETIHIILIILTNNDNQTNSTRIVLLERLGQASQLLTSMIDSCYAVNNVEDNIDTAIKTLLLDGILSLRLRLLTCSITNNNQQIPFLDDFQRELDYYRRLNQLMKLPKYKLYIFESIFRTSAGLNPLQTETLFEYAIQQSKSVIQTKEESSLNLYIISAILLFCHFSPSTVYRYRNILHQAATISLNTNKNNDLNRLQQQCLTLMRQPYFTM